MADFTIRHLYALAESHGYKGPASDWKAMQKHLADLKDDNGEPDPVNKCNWAGEVVDIPSLVFKTAEKPKGRIATLMMDDDAEDRDQKINDMVAKRVEAELAKNGKPKANGRINQVSDSVQVGSVKGRDERMYEARIKCGTSVFKSYDMALGFGTAIQEDAFRKEGKHAQADELKAKVYPQLEQKGYTLTTIGSGSALVPEGYDADLWQLLLEYSTARRACRIVNMTTETVSRPKATGDLTVYYPADGSAGTESSKTWSVVQMRAKQGMVIVKASRSLTQDSAINVADDAGRDIVRAIGKVEDRSLFNADGTGVANNYIPGVQGILNIVSETSTGSRVFKSSATTPAGVTLADLMSLMATPGNFVGRMMAWHCTPQIAHVTLHRLAASVGGIQPREIEGLGLVQTFLGSPIIYNNVMTTNLGTGANRQLAIYGDISLAADFGDRSGLSIEISDQRYWDENNLGIKGTVRHDINVHGLGASTDTGPLAVLIQS